MITVHVYIQEVIWLNEIICVNSNVISTHLK